MSSGGRSGSSPAEPPPITRAWDVTPNAEHVGPTKKKCLTIVALNPISRLSLHVRKMDLATRRMRVVAQVPHGLGHRLQEYAALLARECPRWTITVGEASEDERGIFSGRQIVRTPAELSGGPESSGAQGDELSVISSGTVASIVRLERERDEANARASQALARVAALEDQLRKMSLQVGVAPPAQPVPPAAPHTGTPES
jgi:hypothetical protein